MHNIAWAFAVLILLSVCQLALSDQVKKASSGICHPSESSYYERTKAFEAFDSLEACLKSNGRLPKRLSGNSGLVPAPAGGLESYQRSAFGDGWLDKDNIPPFSRTAKP